LRRALPLALICCCTGTTAHAHVPAIASEDLRIERPEISYAIYGSIAQPEDLFVARLSYAEPFALPFEILVPRRPQLAEHRPAFAVVGPGLPSPSATAAALLPRAVPPGQGVFLEANDAPERELIFESFTRRVFWSSGPIALALAPGDYEIWIFSPTGSTGDFVLGFGVEEDFAGTGCAGLVDDWATYAY
jgi:hypothetical protein